MVLLLVLHGVLADVVLVEVVLVHARLPVVPLANVLTDRVWYRVKWPLCHHRDLTLHDLAIVFLWCAQASFGLVCLPEVGGLPFQVELSEAAGLER